MHPIKSLIGKYGFFIEKNLSPLVPSERHLTFSYESLLDLLCSGGSNINVVQVGANDGSLVDPISQYIKKGGFSSVLVEPQLDVFLKLQHNYKNFPNVKCENLAISNTGDSLTLYRVNPNYIDHLPDWASGLASSDKQVILSHPEITDEMLEKVSIESCRLDDLVAKHSLKKIDILQIDVEGHELEVLKSINLNMTDVKVINLEVKHLCESVISKTVELLLEHAYFIRRNKENFLCYKNSC